jgi:hypothetical protein
MQQHGEADGEGRQHQPTRTAATPSPGAPIARRARGQRITAVAAIAVAT